MSTYTDTLGLEEITPGDQAGLWGNTTNNNLALIDQAVTGVTPIDFDGLSGSVKTLEASNGALDEARSAVLNITGVATGSNTIVVPNKQKTYLVRNSMGQSVVFQTPTPSATFTVAAGNSILVFCDGNNNVFTGIATPSAGTLGVAAGGTGATTFTAGFVKSTGGTNALTSAAGVALGSEVSGTLPLANGGTAATTASGARTSLGLGTVATINTTGSTVTFLRGDGSFVTPPFGTGTVTSITAGTGLSGGTITTSGTVALANTAVTPGSYTNASITVDAQGRLTAASTGTSGGGGTVTSVGGTGTVNGISLSGTVTSSGNLTLGGTLSGVSLTSQVSGTLPVANGGTGQTTYTNGQLLIGNTTGNTLTKSTLTAGSGISITNGTGAITIAATGGTGTVTSVNVSGGTTGLTTSGGPVTGSGTITLAGTLAIANGGTGSATKNFIDLTTAQTSTGIKTFAGIATGGATPVTIGTATASGTGITSQSYNFDSATSMFRNLGTIVISNTATGQYTFETNGTFKAPSIGTSTIIAETGAPGNQAVRCDGILTQAGLSSGMSPNSLQVGAGSYGLTYTSSPARLDILGGVLSAYFTGTSGVQGNNSPNWTTVSDQNLKTNLRPINSALAKLNALNPCHFEYKDEIGTVRSGFIAQEFATVFPGHVTEMGVADNYREFVPEGQDTIKALDPNLMPYLVKALQELSAKVDAQAAKITALEEQVFNLSVK